MNNTALITGASTGIGKELAYIHSQKGGDLVIVARNQSKLEQLKKDLETTYKNHVVVIVKDLSKPNAATELYKQVKEKNIEIDILINNAGFGGIGNFHERSWEQDNAMMQLNMVALTELTRQVLPDMVTKNAGKILNVSSTASLLPGPLQAVYYATKAYVASFSNAIAQELSNTNITVTNLMPGATETEFGKTSGMDKTSLFDKTASANSVALDGYNGMLKGKLDVISGLTFAQKIMLGSLPFTPKKLVLKQIHEMQKTK